MKSSIVCLLFAMIIDYVSSDIVTTICDKTIPPNTLETTPYSSSTTNIVANGKKMIGVFQYYRSIKYISDCEEKEDVVDTKIIHGF
ncbi:A-agglutinin-binding subunit Aga2 [Nakaseomyces glabratus]